MPFIEMPLDDHKEKEPVPAGTYTLRLASYRVRQREDGVNKGIMLIHEIDGEPDARSVIFFMNLVLPEDDGDKKYWKLAFAKGYLKKFELDSQGSGFDPDNWLGATAKVNLEQDVLDDGTAVNTFAENEIAPVT